MAKALTDAQRKALNTIASGSVFVLNNGSVPEVKLSAVTLKSLRSAKLITPQGNVRRWINGRSARRLTLTPQAVALLNA